ncbi:hypothetical protein C8Q74DRAFT_1371617 [Fomes fomentarius]|nr:hypothetical protein C8Q74DRAFT_1371617 [Fomes fomentarius]
MRRLSLFKTSSSSSSQSSLDSGSRPSSILSDTSSSSSVSYVQFPGLSPAQHKSSPQSKTSSSAGPEYAEMLEDDNLAWGKPKKSKNARR